MPLIETKGAASAQGFGLTLGGAQPVYIEDVFSTWLYTGNGSTQTITNGINLSGKGGMIWTKSRSGNFDHAITDSTRYLFTPQQWYRALNTDTTAAEWGGPGTTVNSTGYSLTGDFGSWWNESGYTYASWTFRKQPKFFDVVTYTGNGSAGRTISHNLGSYPGCIIVKKTSAAENWLVWHRSLSSPTTSSSGLMWLNTTNAEFTGVGSIYVPSGNTTTFTVASGSDVNQSGATYVAYLFAHDAGGFGLTGTDNVISCGSYTGNGSATGPTITLGYEPQWLLIKSSSNGTQNWAIHDNMRGLSYSTGVELRPNTLDPEFTSTSRLIKLLATGFQPASADDAINQSGGTYIYIAIRRGPMKVPTSGTSVYDTETGTGAKTTNFPVDMQISANRSGGNYVAAVFDRLRGVSTNNTITSSPWLLTSSTSDELLGALGTQAWNNTGYTALNGSTYVEWNFRRAPSFFDEVCYTGTGSGPLYVPHNLGVVPEFIIIKTRSNISNWVVGQGPAFYISQLYLDSNIARSSTGLDMSMQTSSNIAVGWSSQLSLNLPTNVNVSGYTYVAYLFATCAGVSKVGSYTGTGALQTINCGFTGGARFVLIKRTDSTGDWYVYDSARGISSGNDPYLFLNSNAAEVTGTNYVDTTSVGFQVTAAAPAGLNANGGTYIFLAIA